MTARSHAAKEHKSRLSKTADLTVENDANLSQIRKSLKSIARGLGAIERHISGLEDAYRRVELNDENMQAQAKIHYDEIVICEDNIATLFELLNRNIVAEKTSGYLRSPFGRVSEEGVRGLPLHGSFESKLSK